MARRRNVSLTPEHARRVADGEATLSELAAELGIARQSLHTTFRRKGWPTTPVAAMPSPASTAPTAGPPAPGSPTMAPKGRRKPTSTQSAAPASISPAAPIGAPGAPAPPVTAIASAPVDDDGDLVEVARQELGNVALLVLARARDMLARTQPGPTGLKAVAAAAEVADRLLRRAGIDVANPADEQAPRMIISELTAAEVEATQWQVEAEYRQATGAVEDADDTAPADDEVHEVDLGPRQRAA